MLTLLNIKCDIQPNFASAILFELWEDAQRNHYIKLLYKNNFPSQDIFMELLELEGTYKHKILNQSKIFFIKNLLKGCDELCPLTSFLEMTKDYHVDNILSECELDDGEW